MKRRILFSLIISLVLVFALALVVSAAEIPEWTEITEVDGMPDKSTFGTDGTVGATSRVLMADGITYPAYYICKNSDSLGISLTDLNTKASKSYTNADIVRLEIPVGTVKTPTSALKAENGYTSLKTASFPEGFTTLGGYTFKASTSLINVSLPKTLTSIGESAFTDCSALEELVIPEGVTSIPKNMALNTTSLKTLVLPSTVTTIGETAFKFSNLSNGIVIPEGCTTIVKYAFRSTNATKITLPSTLETVGQGAFAYSDYIIDIYSKSPVIGKEMFYTCPTIETVILENTITIADYAFNNPSGGTTNISTLVLPEGLTSIGVYAFTRNALTEIVLPSTLTTIGQNVFAGSLSLKRVVVLGTTMGTSMFQGCSNLNELVLTENITTMNSQCIGSTSSSFTTYYTGTDYDRISTLGLAAGADRFSTSKTTYCTYEDYLKQNYTKKTCLFVYDINLCEVAFDSNHIEGELENYQTKCTRCGLIVYCENPEHTQEVSIAYDSFLKEGAKTLKCVECSTAGRKVATDPLFVSLGYSVSENGGVTTGFRVNYSAVTEYQSLTGETLNFGLFVAVYDRIGENDIIDLETGETNINAVIADVSNTKLNILNLKITGFETEAQKSANFSFGMFAIAEKDSVKSISYLQHSAPADQSKYSYVSYNTLNA